MIAWGTFCPGMRVKEPCSVMARAKARMRVGSVVSIVGGQILDVGAVERVVQSRIMLPVRRRLGHGDFRTGQMQLGDV